MMKGMVFAERYKLEDFIGQGGMSLVYRAVDIRTGHSVAVKILKSEYNSDKEFLERFQREAQAASLMSHHNLVNLLDVGVEGEYRYLVLEYVNGNTLKDIIRQKGRLNYQTAIQITVRILSALQHAHDNGIIHRDIKPQNVLIHADGHVKVSDFGIARMTNAFTISKGDTVVGSVHYSSPEQATGSVVEATSDIYSTGVVMYEMLTGRVPFVGDTPVAVAMQHVQDPPPPITDFAPETPPAVVAVVMKALEKNPKNRFQSAREMADALMKAKDGKLDAADLQTEVVEVVKAAKKLVDLIGADYIVSVGRGISKDVEGGIKLAHELADVLGGVVGGSRVAIDSGWLTADHQVGQTGKTVHPKVYVALGISGSIQHKAGMSESECIIAVNKNDTAPIFEIADYGICGDLFKVTPMLIEAFKAAKASK